MSSSQCNFLVEDLVTGISDCLDEIKDLFWISDGSKSIFSLEQFNLGIVEFSFSFSELLFNTLNCWCCALSFFTPEEISSVVNLLLLSILIALSQLGVISILKSLDLSLLSLIISLCSVSFSLLVVQLSLESTVVSRLVSGVPLSLESVNFTLFGLPGSLLGGGESLLVIQWVLPLLQGSGISDEFLGSAFSNSCHVDISCLVSGFLQ